MERNVCYDQSSAVCMPVNSFIANFCSMLLFAQPTNNVALVPQWILSESGSLQITMRKQSENIRAKFQVLHAAGRGSSPIAKITSCDE